MSEVPPVRMVQPERAETPAARGPGAVPRGLAAISGIVAAVAALGVGELFAGLIAGVPSPIAAVGSAVIDFAPPGSKDFMVSLFGTNDKTALTVVVVAVVVLVGALVGLLARRSYGLAMAVILGFVGVGLLASLRVAGNSMTLVLVSAALQAGVAIFVLDALLTAARAAGRDDDRIAGPNTARRSFLVRAGALGALAVFGGWFGRSMLEGRAAQVTAAVTEIPPPTVPAAIPGPDASFAIDGLTPLIVPNDEFYRIDTALITPGRRTSTAGRCACSGWSTRRSRSPSTSWWQLPLVEQYVTIACVSNEVGGDLVGNAKWTGVRLADVLEMAGVQPGATQIVPRSVDGWTAGFPTAWITDPTGRATR